MDYTVTYRTADGRTDVLVVEADSRAAVFPLLKARGITAIIRVVEGAAGSKKASSPSSAGRPSPVRGLVAGLIVVALAVGAYFAFLAPPAADAPGRAAPPARPKKAERPLPPPPAADAPAPRPTPRATAPAARAAVEVQARLDLVATTNRQGEVMERWRTPDGKTHARLIPPPPVFDNVIDQTLALVLSVPAGQALPPMPGLGPDANKTFAEALRKPIVIREDDSEAVKKAKLLVQSGREAIFEQLASGKSVGEILADHCAAVNSNAELHRAVGAEYRRLVAEGDAEAAETYRVAANKILETSGAAPVRPAAPRRTSQPKGTERK